VSELPANITKSTKMAIARRIMLIDVVQRFFNTGDEDDDVADADDSNNSYTAP